MIKDQSGAAHLLLIMIVGVTMMAVFMSLSRTSIYAVSSEYEEARSLELRTKLFGCLDEVLLRLQDDNDFNEVTIDTGQVVCDLTITTPAPNEREVYVELNVDNMTRGVEAIMTVNPFDLKHTMTKEIIK